MGAAASCASAWAEVGQTKNAVKSAAKGTAKSAVIGAGLRKNFTVRGLGARARGSRLILLRIFAQEGRELLTEMRDERLEIIGARAIAPFKAGDIKRG